MHYLYKIENLLSGKVYIGITNNPKARENRHFNYKNVFKNKTVNILYRAMEKHGAENFVFSLLCVGDKDYILDLEVKAILAYRSMQRPFGYNIKPGGQSGRGYSVTATPRDVAVFVSGWWFPNRRTACKKLAMTIGRYKYLQKMGHLERLIVEPTGRWQKSEIYVFGFWFPTIELCVEKLRKSATSIRTRLRNGSYEQRRLEIDQTGERNTMYGISQEHHPSSTPVEVNGKLYPSIKSAHEDTGLSKYKIRKLLKPK